ncbi:family 20 glycosylhydrolase [Actinoplanes sp. NPDC000266]
MLKRYRWGAAVAGLLASLTAVPAAAQAAPTRPATIPALQQWTPASGAFRLSAAPRILLRPQDAPRLRSDAAVFAADLRSLTGRTAHVVVTNARARGGDIALQLGATSLGQEGYTLTIGSSVSIRAKASAGAFYGTRTVLQLLKQNTTIPAGHALDQPRYPERGLMMDIGRKPYSYDWLADRVRDMAYLKLNYLHLHFSDDEGWRIESKQGLQSETFLTKKQVRDLVQLAARYHVTVVPEIDMPGHMGAALAKHPEFQLKDANGVARPTKLDYSIPAARKFLRDLVTEYLPLFPGPYWHMGADEFLGEDEFANYPQLEQYAKQTYGPSATAIDGIHGLINDMNKLVRAHGKTLRVWNDTLIPGTTVAVDKNVIVEWWTDTNTPIPSTNPKTPQQLLDEGYTIQNSSFLPTYDYAENGFPLPPAITNMYEEWTVNRFHGFIYFDGSGTGSPWYDVAASEPRLRGSAVHFWSNPAVWTQDEVAASIYPRLRVMAQKTWESPPLTTTYADFEPIVAAVGSAPGVS